jgi:hypothetical protein
MLERFAISVATTTILAVLAKVAVLFHDAKNPQTGGDWLSEPVQQTVLRILLIATFLVFFRGKMMHDDATFFADLAKPGTFRSNRTARALLKVLLPLSYVSWILWGPAIYFMDEPRRLSDFMIASLVLSTICLVLDLVARTAREWRRFAWILPNVVYVAGFLLIRDPAAHERLATWGTFLLLLCLVVDWLVTDPFSGHLAQAAFSSAPPRAPSAAAVAAAIKVAADAAAAAAVAAAACAEYAAAAATAATESSIAAAAATAAAETVAAAAPPASVSEMPQLGKST